MSKFGVNKKKVILLLSAGIGLSLARTPGQYFRVLKETSREWDRINKQSLERSIRALYHSKLIREQENPDGSLTMVLTDQGRKMVITFNIDDMKIKKPPKWDRQWRLVIFDIPEKKRQTRDILRETLKRLGFYEFQKSVFVYPHPCQDEINYLIEYYDIRQYVRTITAVFLDNELHIQKLFNLI